MSLRDIFPPPFYSDTRVEKFIYSNDASSYTGSCKAIVWPKTKDQLHKLILYCRRTSHRLTIRGAATSTFGGTTPNDTIVVDMSKMNKILEINSTHVRVQAGLALSDLNLALGKRIFPVQPLEHPACTIGGMIAMNALGLNTFYGPMSDWVEEMEVVDGTGKVMTLSPRNIQDFIGMEGSTGIIISAKLKILTRPIERTISLYNFNTISAMMDRVNLLQRQSKVLSIEYFDDRASKMMGLDSALHLIVEFNSQAGAIKESEEIKKIDEMKLKVQHEMVRRHFTRKEDPKLPTDQVAPFLHWLRKNQIPCFAHLHLNIVHPCFREPSHLVDEMYTVVEKVKGDKVGQYGVGIHRKGLLRRSKKENYLALKNKYDPKRLINRGVLID